MALVLANPLPGSCKRWLRGDLLELRGRSPGAAAMGTLLCPVRTLLLFDDIRNPNGC
jgi:hypothetical protein